MTVTAPKVGIPTYISYVELFGYRFSTYPTVFAGEKWEYELAEVPRVRSSFRDVNGIQSNQSLDLVIVDKDGQFSLLAPTWFGSTAYITLRTMTTLIDGTTTEDLFYAAMSVTSWSLSGVLLTISLEDSENDAWETLFPQHKYTTENFANLYPDYIGMVVPEIVGFGRKVRCARVFNDPDTYIIGIKGTFGFGVVNAVYRDKGIAGTDDNGTIRDPSGQVLATIGDWNAGGGFVCAALTFTLPQPATSVIEVDYDCRVQGGEFVNAALELDRIMTYAGLSIDSTSLAAAETVADNNLMRIDHVYRRQRTVISIVEDYLLLLRGNLARTNSFGAKSYEIIQDVARSQTGTYRESSELIDVNSRGQSAKPSKVVVEYGVSPIETGDSYNTIERNVVGGTGGAPIPIRLPFTSNPETADRYLSYYAKRIQYSGFCNAEVYGEQLGLGDRIGINFVLGVDGDWTIRGIDRDANSNDMELQEYNADMFVYTPGTLPADPTEPYQPDFSNTNPEAPTDHTNFTSGTTVDTTGKVIAYQEVYALPPTSNVEKIVFVIKDTTDNTLQAGDGLDLYATNYRGFRFDNLKPARNYETYSYSVNKNNLQSLPTTAVPVTTPGKAALPATVTVTGIVQGKGLSTQLFWNPVPDRDVSHYVIDREVFGSNNWVMLDDDNRAASYTDVWNLSYGGNGYRYRVAAVDTSGNQGPYGFSIQVTLAQNIGNTDGNTGDPFDADTMITNQMTAKQIRTSSSGKRIELNWGLDNEVQVFDNGGIQRGAFGFTGGGSDFTILDIGGPTYIYTGINSEVNSNTWSPGFFYNYGNASAITCTNESSNEAAIIAVSLGSAEYSIRTSGGGIQCNGTLDLNSNLEISGNVIGPASFNISPSIESPGFIWTRNSMFIDDDLWVGYISGLNSWRIIRDGPTGELRFYPPNITGSYYRFNSVGQFDWIP